MTNSKIQDLEVRIRELELEKRVAELELEVARLRATTPTPYVLPIPYYDPYRIYPTQWPTSPWITITAGDPSAVTP